MNDNKKREAYLVGAGIASLATAAYLIRDGRIPGGIFDPVCATSGFFPLKAG